MEPMASMIVTPTPPKLSLKFSLQPGQASDPASPPPMRNTASVPFLWEEAPGKPRQWRCGSEPEEETVSKSLGLPPRLLMPSPTTVLDGPDVLGRSMSFTFSGGSFGREIHRGGGGYFASSRWGSFRKAKAFSVGSLDISPSPDDSLTVDEDSGDTVDPCGGDRPEDLERRDGKVVIAKVFKRRGSFLTLSRRSHKPSSHNLLAGIYESFKQMVPWRRRQEKQRLAS